MQACCVSSKELARGPPGVETPRRQRRSRRRRRGARRFTWSRRGNASERHDDGVVATALRPGPIPPSQTADEWVPDDVQPRLSQGARDVGKRDGRLRRSHAPQTSSPDARRPCKLLVVRGQYQSRPRGGEFLGRREMDRGEGISEHCFAITGLGFTPLSADRRLLSAQITPSARPRLRPFDCVASRRGG
jgi:hypothetical protein